MLLHELKKNKSAFRKAKRVGRGNSSGKGNYSTRGLKGQGQRSGGKMPSWFEGGQTPLNQRLPKLKGFKRPDKLVIKYTIINLDRLEKDERIKDNSTIDKTYLVELNYVKSDKNKIKILGKGKLKKKLNFVGIDVFSNSAKTIIEKAGGKVE